MRNIYLSFFQFDKYVFICHNKKSIWGYNMQEIDKNFLINVIAKYCEDHFKDGNIKVQLENYSGFLLYLKYSGTINVLFDITNITLLIDSSYKLKKMIKIIKESNLNDEFLNDRFLNMLLFNDLKAINNNLNNNLDTMIIEFEDDDECEYEFEENLKYRKEPDALSMYLKELNYPVLSKEEERDLLIKYKKYGDKKAREKLIEHNLRYVKSIAKKYMRNGIDLIELIQEGNIGLMAAIDSFDLSKEFRKSTYVKLYIVSYIQRFIINNGKNIRIPVYLYQRERKVKNAIKHFQFEFGKDPTVEELAKFMDYTVKQIINILTIPKTLSMHDIISNGGEESEHEDFIEDEKINDDTFIGNIYSSQFLDTINNSDLSDREKKVIFYRFGFFGNEPFKLKEIGKIVGVSRQRVKEIENKAKKKLKPVLESFRDR